MQLQLYDLCSVFTEQIHVNFFKAVFYFTQNSITSYSLHRLKPLLQHLCTNYLFASKSNNNTGIEVRLGQFTGFDLDATLQTGQK